MTDMDHKRCEELIPWYVNGTLQGEELADVRRHIGQCLPCRSILEEERRTHTLIRRQPDIPLTPEHGMVGLLEKIDRRGGAPRRSAPRRRPIAIGLAAACLVGLAVAALLVYREPGGPAEFATLSADSGSAADRIDVILAPGVGETGLRGLLDDIGGAVDVSSVLHDLADDPRVRFAGPALIEPAPSGEVDP